MLNSQTLLSQRVSFLYMIYQSDHLSKTPGVKTHRFCTKLEKHASWKKNDEFFADPFYTFPSEVRQRSPWGPRSLCALIISCHILYQRTRTSIGQGDLPLADTRYTVLPPGTFSEATNYKAQLRQLTTSQVHPTDNQSKNSLIASTDLAFLDLFF